MDFKEIKKLLKEDNGIYLMNDLNPFVARLNFLNNKWCIEKILPNGRVDDKNTVYYESFRKALEWMFYFDVPVHGEPTAKEVEEYIDSQKPKSDDEDEKVFCDFICGGLQNFLFKKKNVILVYMGGDDKFVICKETVNSNGKKDYYYGEDGEWEYPEDQLNEALESLKVVV